jgi:starvation-inducible DNA-binding protein
MCFSAKYLTAPVTAKKHKTTVMKPKIGIAESSMKDTATLLSAILANEMILYIKVRKFHWNVSGESFMELHKLFESQYKQLEESIDEVAERIGKLGEKAIGTATEFVEWSSLKESPGKYDTSKNMIIELLSDHEMVIVQLRRGVDSCAGKLKDAGTADFLTGLMEDHETMAWVLRRYLN